MFTANDCTIAWHTRFVEHGGGTHAAGGLPMDTVATTILWHLFIPRSIHSLVRENWPSRRTYVFLSPCCASVLGFALIYARLCGPWHWSHTAGLAVQESTLSRTLADGGKGPIHFLCCNNLGRHPLVGNNQQHRNNPGTPSELQWPWGA